jgi:site-specific DNA-methyltransferase (adenine-specific)
MSMHRPSVKLYRRYSGRKRAGTVHTGDALDFLKSLPAGSARVIFLDPPFNLGKIYGRSRRSLDQRPELEYQKWLTDILDQSIRVLADGGALYLYHLPQWAMRLGVHLEKALTFKQWIAISMKNGFVRGKRLYPAHYALLMFSKGNPAVLNRPKLQPALCRHCGKYVKDYGGYKSIIDSKGINLSDYWDDVSPVRHAKRKNRSANELPEVIFGRVMQISGTPEGLYVDPFAGAGGGVVAAARAGMRFQACDIFASNCRLVVKRLDNLDTPPARPRPTPKSAKHSKC